MKNEVPGFPIDTLHRGQPVVHPGTTGTSCTSQPTTSYPHTDSQIDAFEERAAIIEYEASVPRGWAEGLARLDQTVRPPEIDAEAWRQLIDDGGHFLDKWGGKADRLGWSAVDVFGVRSVQPHAGYEAAGLAHLIRGGEVVAIDPHCATIRTPSGATLTYLRRTRTDAIVIWDLVDPVMCGADGLAKEADND